MNSIKRPYAGLTVLAFCTVLIGPACGDPFGPDNDPPTDEPALAEVELPLSSRDKCPTLSPDATFNGGGSVRTNRSYDHSGCWWGYLLDINDYDPGNAGTLVYYGDSVPTTETTCTNLQVRVYVWRRNADGTTTYLGGRFPRGRWLTNNIGQQYCELPAVHVEAAVDGYAADGGDYRLGLRAQDVDSSGNKRRRQIYVETVRRVDPEARRSALYNEIASAASGTIASKVHAVWALRSTGGHQIQCRTFQVARSLYDFTRASFIKAGSSAAAVDAARSALDSMYGALCAKGGSESHLQATLKQYLEADARMRSEIAAAIGSTVPGADPDRIAQNIMTEIIYLDIGRLVSNCNASVEPVANFLLNGSLPAGVSADRLLLGECSGSPQQVALNLGVGGTLGASATRARLKACFAPPNVGGDARDICHDPRASGAASESDDNDGLKPEQCQRLDGQGKCTDEQDRENQEAYEREQQELADYKARLAEYEKLARVAAQAREEGERQARERILREIQENRLSPVEIALDMLLNVMSGGVVSLVKTYHSLTGLNPLDPCPLGPGKCEAYCAPDFAPGGWYGSVQEFNYGPQRQLNQFDLAAHCLCRVMEEEYAERTGIDPGLSSACPTGANQLQLECLANPFGPDDAPRPECIRFLLPGDVSDDSWMARICHAKRCAEDGLVPTQTDADGTCECQPPTDTLGGTDLGCNTSEVAYCTEDNPGPCQCLPTNNGAVPHGNNPFCRLDPSSWPGSFDALLPSSAEAVTMHRQQGETFVMLNARVEQAPSFVAASYNREAFANLGTAVRQRAVISASPRTGQNLDLQLYCTNYDNNLIHNYMGQCRLNGLTPGVSGNCDITLNSSTRDACLQGAFNFEYVSQAPATYAGSVGVGPWAFTGSLTPQSDAKPVCPRPDPLDVFPQTNPLWELAGGIPAVRNPLFELADGTVREIPSTLYLPEWFSVSGLQP